MDRRTFFRRAAGKTAEAAVGEAQRRVEKRVRWIRPPFALAELEFLLACTRCGACVEACPHHVVFLLSSALGADLMSTPALDLKNRGCHLCSDWPCVAACEPGALIRPEVEGHEGEPKLPILAAARVETSACLPYQGPECGACRDSCPVPGAMHWYRERPAIRSDRCTGCAMCREACIAEPKAIAIGPAVPQ